VKPRKTDWLLAALWLGYYIFLGPFLLSARDWFLVAAAFAVFGGLAFWTYRVVMFHKGVQSNA
jgi:hypothetical protein